MSYDAQVAALREALSAAYERAGRWSEAAGSLAGVDDGGADAPGALERSVRVADLYLRGGDAAAAEQHVKKAAQQAQSCADAGLLLRYRACQARVLDARCRFLEAATAFLELSREPALESSSDALEALAAAVRCAVLSAAGARRSRLLARLVKDDRTARLPTRALLEKVALERLLSDRAEVASFAATLAPHQRATADDVPGAPTVLARAVLEHNLESASRLFTRVTVPGLARLLGVSPAEAERAAARMALEGRLAAEIDQVAGVIEFGGHPGPAALRDQALQDACVLASSLTDRIGKGVGAVQARA